MRRPSAVVVRCDGGAVFGIGHVSRCLTLGDAFVAQGTPVRFVTAEGPSLVGGDLIRRRGFPVEAVADMIGTRDDARAFLAVLQAEADPLAIVDAPDIDAEYLSLISRHAVTLCIHDVPGAAPPAQIVLNQNLDAAYTGAQASQLHLLGPRYNLVRKAFFAPTPPRREEPARIVITLGGEDAHNHTRWILAELGNVLAGHDVDVIVGPSHPDPASIFALAETVTNVRIRQNPPDMAKLLLGATLAITAGGTTCYELAAAGVPQLGFVAEEHQRRMVMSMIGANAMLPLSDYQRLDGGAARSTLGQVLHDELLRDRLAEAGRNLLSGPGAPRAANSILAHFAACCLGHGGACGDRRNG